MLLNTFTSMSVTSPEFLTLPVKVASSPMITGRGGHSLVTAILGWYRIGQVPPEVSSIACLVQESIAVARNVVVIEQQFGGTIAKLPISWDSPMESESRFQTDSLP